jgi:chloramphenicol O-acetyltransferase type B
VYLIKMWNQVRQYIGHRRRGVPKEVLKRVGINFACGFGAFFRPNEDIFIGSNVFMGRNVHIAAPCVIKNDVMLASYVAFVGGDHGYSKPRVMINARERNKPELIIIEEDVWIGHGAIILAGIKIERGSIIAAGGVVTKDVPACTIWGGAPAHFLRNRFLTEEEKRLHLEYLDERYKDVK